MYLQERLKKPILIDHRGYLRLLEVTLEAKKLISAYKHLESSNKDQNM